MSGQFINKYGPRAEGRYDEYRKVMRPLQAMGILNRDYEGVIKPGTLGNYFSYFTVFDYYANNLAPGELFLSFEDDVIIKNPTEFTNKFEYLMTQLPDDFAVCLPC